MDKRKLKQLVNSQETLTVARYTHINKHINYMWHYLDVSVFHYLPSIHTHKSWRLFLLVLDIGSIPNNAYQRQGPTVKQNSVRISHCNNVLSYLTSTSTA